MPRNKLGVAIVLLSALAWASCSTEAARRGAERTGLDQSHISPAPAGLPSPAELWQLADSKGRAVSRYFVQEGAESYMESPGAVPAAPDLLLDASPSGPGGGLDFEWAVYGCGPVQGNFVDITVNPGSVDGKLYVASPDYSTGRWLWYGPYTSGVGFSVDPVNCLSPAGQTFCAVAVPRGSNVTINNVTFNTDSSSGVVYPDPSDQEGINTSIQVVDGKPAISYGAGPGGNELRFIRALDRAGGIWGAAVTVDSASARDTCLRVVNGMPAISYYDATAGDLKYVRAADASGSAWAAPQTLDSANDTGKFTSMEIVDGNPAISYYDADNGQLRYIRANDADGLAWSSPQTVDADGFVGRYCSLLMVAGNPAISYYSETAGALRYVRAVDSAGGTWGTPVTVDTTDNTGSDTCLAVIDGFPAISYYDLTNDQLQFVRASDVSGTAWGAPITVDSDGIVGTFSKLMLNQFGMPVIAYLDGSNSDLRFVIALDAQGTGWGTPQVLDSADATGYDISMTLVNGRPGISYFNFSKLALSFTTVE
ncbi:hypothetical protein IT575_13450 [bacterium]|nr:hypothetical protein [bacterium]